MLLTAPEPPNAGQRDYPDVPDEEDLIGFVTTGNFNLGEGRATGVGSLLLEKVMHRPDDAKGTGKGVEREHRICIVRNAGERIGRLARWDII